DTKAMVGFLLAAVAVYLVVRKPKKVKNESVKSHSYLTE
ncbi:EamA family transporter, partial [Vibrio vulnificus]